MNQQEILTCYYEWLTNKIFKFTQDRRMYSKLLRTLYSVEFTFTVPKDINRYNDGLELKKTFCWEVGLDSCSEALLGTQCSVLEMMVALADRCEVQIMADPALGNRTAKWFMEMLHSMHLDEQTDYIYDEDYVEERIAIMLNRQYDENGDGSLFMVNNSQVDMRTVEIWIQLNWYLAENFN